MSWLYSRALVEAYSEATSSDGAPSAPWNVTPTPPGYSSHVKTTEASRRSRSGMTYAPLTDDLGEAWLTWFRAAFRAKTSPSPEAAPALTENAADCGGRWRESLARFDRDSSSWKIPQCSLLGASEPSSVIWPRWGMMLGGVCWAQSTPERRTNEIGSGLWPTPTVLGNYNRKGASAKSGDGLETAVRNWPTPTAQDAKNNGAPSQMDRNTKPLNAEVGGALNPTWVEWLMGWPLGWTDLGPLETGKFQQWRRLHGEL